MKNRATRILAALLLISMCLFLFTACVSLDRAEERLKDAGYTVVRYGKGAPEHLENAVDEDVEATLVATGGPNGEKITLIRFKDKELAKEFEELEKKANEKNYFYTVKREGKVVIFGWTNAYDLIK